MVSLSPLFSLFLWLYALPRVYSDYLQPIMWHTGIHITIIAVQVCGLILYFIGYKSRGPSSFGCVGVIMFINALLVLWGLLTIWFALGWYNSLLEWSMEPETRELIIWDHMQHGTWILKGVLWAVIGMTFMITSCKRFFPVKTVSKTKV